MPLRFSHLEWLAALVLAVPLVLVWQRQPAPFSRRQRVASLVVRLTLVVAIVLALAGPAVPYRATSQILVVVADRSTSTATAQSEETAAVQSLAPNLPAHDQLGVVTFGQDALVEDPPERQLQFTGFETSPRPNFTNIEAALQLSASLAGAQTGRHLLLISDGRENVGDAVGEARLLHSEGARVDVLPLRISLGPDVRVDSVDAPATVPPSSRALVTAVLVSNETTPVRLVWTIDNSQVVLDTVVKVRPGVTRVNALLPPATPGFHEVKVEIAPDRDAIPGNDVGEALFQALGRQEVLVVQGQAGAGGNVAHALTAAGIAVDVVAPSQMPVTVAGLARWQAVALVDVSADELGEPRMTALASAAEDLGVGLAAFGGPDTFGPGALAGTPLETALPIEMKVPDPEEKPPVAVMLVLETVESTSGDTVLRDAAERLVAHLAPRDLVGVTNGYTGVVLPLRPVGNGKKIEREISNIAYFGDPPSYVPYMQDAARALAAYPGATRYILVLGDGDADTPLPSVSFMADLVKKGITVSTVGADVHDSPQYMANMAEIAAEGNGRFYDSESADQLPSIFLDETQVELQPWIVRERFRLVGGAASPALDGIDPASLPPLDGYVAATPKPSAEVVLSGPAGDPVLAQWQYGLGTAVAWTSDTQGLWSAQLLRSPLAGKLFAGIVASTLPLAADATLSLSAQLEGDTTHVVARAPGLPPDASAVVHVVGPGGQGSEVPLAETAPGRFEGDVVTSGVGAYLMRAEISVDGRSLHAATIGVAVAYSPELRYIGTDPGFLEQVAEAGGGVVLSSARQALAEPVPSVDLDQPLWGGLLVLAIVLLPLDVALRRLDLRRAQSPVPRSERTEEVPHPGRPWAATDLPQRERPDHEPSEAEPVLATRLRERLKR